jgi:hypothetical protein
MREIKWQRVVVLIVLFAALLIVARCASGADTFPELKAAGVIVTYCGPTMRGVQVYGITTTREHVVIFEMANPTISEDEAFAGADRLLQAMGHTRRPSHTTMHHGGDCAGVTG